jgi:hypothetical protein
MVTRYRRRRHDSGSHDIAGWLYADVFLALMIVGVGSSVVVRQAVPSVSASPSPASSRTVVSCNEFAIVIDAQTVDVDDDQLGEYVETQIADEIASRGWFRDDADPALVIVLGGFELYESAGDGDMNARRLRERLRQVVPSLSQVEMRTGGARSTVVGSDRVQVGNNGDFALITYLLHTNDVEPTCQ